MDYKELVQRIESQDRETCTNAEPDGLCPVCHGIGYEFITINNEMGEYPNTVRECPACKGNLAQRASQTKAQAHIPDNQSLKTFNWEIYSGYDISKQKKTVEAFVDRFHEFEEANMGLFLTSKTRGSGKTFLASCICGELINRYDVSTAIVNVSDLLSISQRKSDEGGDPIEKLISYRVLVLDDLGQKQTGREWLTDILFRIIDKRYQQKRIVIVTSNEPLRELDFDDRIVDRLNAITCMVKLPEYCVRALEANNRKKVILQKLGIE